MTSPRHFWFKIATLRTKTLAILVTTLAGLLVIASIPLRLIILERFVELEHQSVQQNLERTANAVANEVATLDSTAADYANWDDTYAFATDGNAAYRENYVDATFVANRLNLVVIVNTAGQILFDKVFNLTARAAVTVPERMRTLVSADDSLLRLGSVNGVVVLPEGAMLIAARPIMTSAYTGPVRGTLIMGRSLDAAEIARLAETTRLALSLHPLDDPGLPDDVRAARDALPQHVTMEVRALSEQTIAGYTLIRDVYGAPGLIARIESARDIYQRGQASIRYFALSLLATGAVFGAVVLVLLGRIVLARLARLDAEVRQIGTSGDQSARVAGEGADELGRLASGINTMLAALEQAQQQRQQSDEARAHLQEELIRAREQMIQMAVHDLKNPLTAISGFLHLLKVTELTPLQRELIERSARSTINMADLAETFLDMARMQEGRLAIQRAPCNVAALLEGCARELSIWAEQDAQSVAVAIAEPLPDLFIDAGLMRRVMLNLLSNAIKHTPPGTSITIGATIAADRARLWVHDTGPGILADQQAQIFDRFNSSPGGHGRQGNTGLGLTFCKLAAEAHCGTIELCSAPGCGTTFAVLLPLDADLSVST